MRVGPYAIHELTAVSVADTLSRIEALMGVGASEGNDPLLTPRQIQIASAVLADQGWVDPLAESATFTAEPLA